MSERLRVHALRRRMDGFPIFGQGVDVDGYEEDEIKGRISEPEWLWSDLTAEERSIVETDAKLLVIASADRTPEHPLTNDQAFGFSLAEHGIACPHRWINHEDGRGVAIWRDCRVCYATQQIPGRVVRAGSRWIRVEEPPPPTVRLVREPTEPVRWVNDSDPSPIADAPPIDEYRWNGRAYEIASR